MNDDKVAPCVLIELGGEKRQIEFTLWADLQIKRLTGKSILQQTIDTDDPNQLLALLWGGLITHIPELDGKIAPDGTCDDAVTAGLEKVSKWMTFDKLKEAGELLKMAFGQAAPESKAKGKNG